MRPALLLCLLLPLAACDSADDSAAVECDAEYTATGALSGAVDGDPFDADCLAASVEFGVLSVAALEPPDADGPNSRQISLIVLGARVGANRLSVAVLADVDLDDPDTAAAGTYTSTDAAVTLDALSADGASGTFSFTARNNAGQTVRVSDGAFDVAF